MRLLKVSMIVVFFCLVTLQPPNLLGLSGSGDKNLVCSHYSEEIPTNFELSKVETLISNNKLSVKLVLSMSDWGDLFPYKFEPSFLPRRMLVEFKNYSECKFSTEREEVVECLAKILRIKF